MSQDISQRLHFERVAKVGGMHSQLSCPRLLDWNIPARMQGTMDEMR